jgi:extradiol dioxygenase family protein
MVDGLGFVRRSDSLLGYEHFQNAYVTNDLDRAVAMLGDTFGVEEFQYTKDFPLPGGGVIDVAMAWAGNVMIEILQGRGNPNSFYERHIPSSDFAVKFHHFGYVVRDQATWDGLLERIAREKRDIPFEGSQPGVVSWIYIDAPELGHYLEYIMPSEPYQNSLDNLPRY